MKVAIKSITYSLGSISENNDCLKKDNPDWDIDAIVAKTGVEKRYLSKDGETAVDLAIKAGNKLLEKLEDISLIDGVVFVTQSPDYFLPSSCCIIQEKLGLRTDTYAVDLNQGCSGYIYGLAHAGSLIESGLLNNVLLLTADTYSRYISKTDRSSRPLFSDGASASLITWSDDDSVSDFIFGTDGSGANNLIVESGAMRDICSPNHQDMPPELKMNGANIFMFTLEQVPKGISAILAKSGLGLDQIDLIVPHQASKLVLDNLVRKLGIKEEKLYRNYEDKGNTVSSTIPIAMSQARDEGRIKEGSLVLAIAFGVGYSWAGCLIKVAH